MSNWRNKVLALVFMLVLAVALTACGGSDNLEGTFVVEGDEYSGITLVFANDDWTLSVPYAEMGLDYDLEGSFVFGGTFSIDNRNNLINFYVDEQTLRLASIEMTEMYMNQMFIELGIMEMLEDPEFADYFQVLQDEMDMLMDMMLDEVFEEMLEDFDDMSLRFERNFDRLYDDVDESVFVRQ